MSNQDFLETLNAIDTKLAAMLAIQIHQTLREDPELAAPRPRSIDKMLHDVGLTQTQIAALLGKSSQAVSQMVAKG